jgi:hypothetical protein
MAPQPDKSWGKGPTTIEDIADPPGRREPPVRYNVLAGRVVDPSVPAPIWRLSSRCSGLGDSGWRFETHRSDVSIGHHCTANTMA